MKIAVLLPNWVGDLAMATPAVRALRQRFPDATLVGIIKPYLTDILTGTPWIDVLLPAEHQQWLGNRGFWSTVSQLRSLRLDAVVSFRGTLRGGWLAVASGSRRRYGFGHNSASRLYTHRYSPTLDAQGRQAVSAVDIYLETVALMGGDTDRRTLELATTPHDERAADDLWQRLALPPAEQVVMLNGGAAQSAAKMWPIEHFARLARRLVDERGVSVLVNCGPKERDQAREIVRLADRPTVKSLADEPKLPFGLLKALIRRARLLVSTDSGPRHLAAAFGTPTVALLGPIDPRVCHNYNPAEQLLRLELPCSPCNKYECPLGHTKCMKDLSVDSVFSAADRALQTTRRSAA